MKVISLMIGDPSKTILCLSENGFGKRTKLEDFPSYNRGGQGVIALKTSDRNGNIDNVQHATINMNVQDVLNLDVNVSGHPLWIKSSQTTGESNGVIDIPALNNGATSGTISWVPYNAGTYYYICQHHGSMVGTIIVS